MVWLIRWVVRVVAALLAFLLFETGVAGIPDSIASQYAFLASLNEEWLIRLAALVLGFFLTLVAIGPYRVQAWIKWASPDHSTSTAVPPTADAVSAVGVYREPVGETYRDPLQVEEESDEEFLRRRCRELAQRLFSFLDEQGYSKHERPNDPERTARQQRTSALQSGLPGAGGQKSVEEVGRARPLPSRGAKELRAAGRR